MKIIYQGKEVETTEETVGAFLAGRSVNLDSVIVEYKGDVLTGGPSLDSLELEEGASLDAFNIVSGG